MSWTSEVLYQRTSTGKTRTWQVFADGDSVCTETGDYGGSKKKSSPTKYFAKNVGRSNERSAEQVAIDTAKSKRKDKLDSGYVVSLEKLAKQEAIPRAMLAKPKFEKELKRVEVSIKDGACFVQPKLDGFRCLADRRGLWTRNLRPITTCNHIANALAPVFDLYPDLVIDGELYNHELKDDFGKIQSLLTKDQPDFIDALEAERSIEYHVYDFIDEGDFKRRFLRGRSILSKNCLSSSVVHVKTSKASSVDFIHEKHASFLSAGYEGTMIRLSKAEYEQNKRASQLIKLKDFHDEEFTIVEVKEGKGQWTGFAKSITCCLKGTDETFDAGCKGTQNQLRSLLEMKHLYEGGKATVQFAQKFPSGKPRFPIATKYFTT